MSMQCNIDARGRIARFIWGAIALLAGVVVLLAWAWPGGGWIAWVIGVGLLAGGAFALFEARAGWCAVRAMGFKTPI